MKRRAFVAGAVAVPLAGARAQGRAKALISLNEGGPNSMDGQVPGANHTTYQGVWNMYDRLVTFGVRRDEAGNEIYDHTKPLPEGVDDVDVGDMSITFRLNRERRFHDGTVVTARDLKWSMDRAFAVGGVPKSQFTAVSVERAEQFVLVDDRTLRLDLTRPDKMVVQSLGVPTAQIYNSALVQSHATASDPWGVEWTRNNVAGGGAYRLDRWVPGQELAMVRYDGWAGGERPDVERVIARVVPSAGTRRALLERGDADLSYDLPPQDASEMAGNKALTVLGIPTEGTVQFVSFNVRTKPFDALKVRQAISYAIPYDKIIEVALFRRAKKLAGGPARVSSPDWPQAGPYDFDLDKARALLVEAGYADGFDVTMSFDLGAAVVNEPMCVLIQEALGKIGVRVTLEKIPGANWRGQFSKKSLALLTNVFGAWYPYPDYYFWQVNGGGNSIFNTSSYISAEMDRLIDTARFTSDAAVYAQACKGFIQLGFDDLPNIPVFQPYLNVATRSNVSGFRYWFHREIDYRHLRKV